MSEQHSPSPGILETVVTDDSLLEKDASTHASRDEDASAASKHVMKAYRRAKKAGDTRDARSRQMCAVQRAKREGTVPPVDLGIRKEPVTKVQTVLSDF
jgi:hypothetical protein